MCSSESEPDQLTVEEVAGLPFFNPDERIKYFSMKEASKDMSLTPKQRKSKISNSIAKLRMVIEKRMPMDEKLVLQANKQAEADRKHQENLQCIEKTLSLFTPTRREDYDTLLAGATDPKARHQNRKRSAVEESETAESPEEMEEETAKKSKIEVVEGGE
jgi:hypothetical protein